MLSRSSVTSWLRASSSPLFIVRPAVGPVRVVGRPPCTSRRWLSTLVHGKPAPAPHGVLPTGIPPPPFKADDAKSKRLFRASVAGFVAFTAYVGFTAYDGFFSAKARAAAEEAVLAIPLFKGNPVVYLDFSADNVPLGRVVIQLRKDLAPKAAGGCSCTAALPTHRAYPRTTTCYCVCHLPNCALVLAGTNAHTLGLRRAWYQVSCAGVPGCLQKTSVRCARVRRVTATTVAGSTPSCRGSTLLQATTSLATGRAARTCLTVPSLSGALHICLSSWRASPPPPCLLGQLHLWGAIS
jgi:hypothetical protein